MKKKTRAIVGLMGFSSYLVASLMASLLGGTEAPISIVLAIGGGLGFFVAWWIASSRYRDAG